MLVEGIEPLGDGAPPGGPPKEPGRYHSHRLGTEVVFDVPESFRLGQHEAGNIGWDTDDGIFFVSRWGTQEPLTPDEWVAELLDSGWNVTETDVDAISGYATRRFDIEPTSNRETIGGVAARGALVFGDGLPRRVWIIEQDDPQPLVIGTGIAGQEWSDLVDGVVASLEVGPTITDPRNGREAVEYGGIFWEATAEDRYRTLLFGDTILRPPVDLSALVGSQSLSFDVPGDHTGLAGPTIDVSAVGQLIIPPDDPSAGIFASTLADPPDDAAGFVAFLELLAERGLVSDIRETDIDMTLLGSTATAIDFDVPNGSEIGGYLSQPDGWSGRSINTFMPTSTHRVWAMDLNGQVAVVVARADVGNTEDLDAATEFAQTIATAFARA